MFGKYFYFIISVIFFSKKKFSRPSRGNYLIINGDHSELIKKYIKRTEVDVVYSRFARGIEKDSEINLYVLFITIIKFKFTINEYVKNYIKISEPKVIITLIDNDKFFYELREKNSNFKSILIQNSFRSTQRDVFYNSKELKTKNFFCDYILCFNNYVGELYKEFLHGEVIQIGAFRSNCIKINNTKKKIDILYVSSFKGQADDDFFIKDLNITYGEMRQGEYKLIENLKKFLIKNNHIKLSVLGKKNIKDKEKLFWNKKLEGINFNFIPQSDTRNTYQIIDEAKLLISIDSTLGYESIARGNKICVFSVRGNKYPYNSSKFGWPSELSEKGFFWTNSVEYDEFERVLSHTYEISEQDYFMNKVKNIIPDQIIFDEDNKIFQKIIKALGTGNGNN